MLSMVAVVPEPPLLVPELATGAAAETAALRAACREAARLLAAASSAWVAVGADAGGRRTVSADARGSFVGFGADVVVGLGPHAGAPVDAEFPLPLLIAGWLRDGLPVAVRGELVAPDADSATCLALGAALAREAACERAVQAGEGTAAAQEADTPSGERPGLVGERVAPAEAPAGPTAASAASPSRVAASTTTSSAPTAASAATPTTASLALLVVGDGAATHTLKAPGYLDQRAGPFDDAVAAALATADTAALAALDPILAAELWASGRAPWQVLAGATRDGTWEGELLHSSRPFGVAYHVAVWRRCG